jgi:hypothetical protein
MLDKLLGSLGIKKENRHIVLFILVLGLLLTCMCCYNNHKSNTYDFMSPSQLNSVNSQEQTNGSAQGRLENLLREDEGLQGSDVPIGSSTDTHGLPQDSVKMDTVTPSDLLPRSEASEWADSHQDPSGILNNVKLLPAGSMIGIDTVGQTLRNANLQLRAEPPNPKLSTGPWNNTTIEGNPSYGIQECN